MIIRLFLRHLLLFAFLTACDDLPDQPAATQLAGLQSPETVDTLQARLSRPSPPAVYVDTFQQVRIEVNYGAPSVRGRTIFGDLVPYGKIWRTGANEATTITLSDSMLINQQVVAPGTYAVFTIPGPEVWTWVLNKEYDQWGAYNYDPELNVLETTARPHTLSEPVETMRFVREKNELQLQWADLAVPLHLSPR